VETFATRRPIPHLQRGDCEPGRGHPLGIRLASVLVVLRLDLADLAPRPPELPHRQLGALTQLAVSATLHATLVGSVWATVALGPELRQIEPTAGQPVRQVVFLAPELPVIGGGGGGGGGQQQPGPLGRAHGIGSDTITLRVRKRPPPAVPVTTVSAPAIADVSALPSMVLDAKALAAGFFDQLGLPTSAMLPGTSAGPGSGGGVGTGIGTGVGPGRGPGLGPGSGGGTGGGTSGGYRPGGAVSAPRLIKEVKPRYTPEALRRKIQGTVVLEVLVTSDGFPSNIRVVKSLDRGGLDSEAALAVAQWRFEPGRLAGAEVDVLVTIMIDFALW